MKYIYVLLILLFFTISACEKDEVVELTYPSTYRSVRYENVSKIRLFTKNGEITSEVVIGHFAKRFSKDTRGNDYLYPKGISVPVEQLTFNPFDSIQLVSSSLAIVKAGNSSKEYNLKRAGNEIEFTSVDTTFIFIPNMDDIFLNINIGIHKPSYIEDVTPSIPSSGASFKKIYKGFLKKYATVTPNQLVFFLMNYVIAHTVKGIRLPENTPVYSTNAQAFSNMNDKFDPSAFRQLTEKDTLAIQEFRVVYER